ncbi:MAG: hypothetical protein ACYC4E_01100 [Carboxydocellales bacterium]
MKKHITLMSSAWFILAAIIAVTTVIYLAWDNGSLAYSKVINRSINGGDVIIADQGKIRSFLTRREYPVPVATNRPLLLPTGESLLLG